MYIVSYTVVTCACYITWTTHESGLLFDAERFVWEAVLPGLQKRPFDGSGWWNRLACWRMSAEVRHKDNSSVGRHQLSSRSPPGVWGHGAHSQLTLATLLQANTVIFAHKSPTARDTLHPFHSKLRLTALCIAPRLSIRMLFQSRNCTCNSKTI